MAFDLQQSKRRVGQFLADTHGAAIVEFSMVLPVFLLIFFGVIGWSYHLIALDHVYDAARNTARQIAVGSIAPEEAEDHADMLLEGIAGDYTVNAKTVGHDGMVGVSIEGPSPLAAYVGGLVALPELSAVVYMKEE